MVDNAGYEVIGESGTPLKARFDVSQVGRFQIRLHSRGGTEGTPDERNPDYAIGLQQLLRKLSLHETSIVDITVDTETMMKKAQDPVERRLDLAFPIPLHHETNFGDLVHRIGNAQRVVGSKATTSAGGNRTRRICLTVDVHGVCDRTRLLSILGH
ncbi:MAG: hypothetical protein VX243_04345 [Actinomycetota bacterium]|nr:hypothetical protein [Actinomycetota bacterium]